MGGVCEYYCEPSFGGYCVAQYLPTQTQPYRGSSRTEFVRSQANKLHTGFNLIKDVGGMVGIVEILVNKIEKI